jgi:20S proteasome subunit beta 6
VIDLVVDVFNSAAERDIRTGDSIEIVLIEPSGITIQRFPLRKD